MLVYIMCIYIYTNKYERFANHDKLPPKSAIFHMKDLKELTGFRGLVPPSQGTDEESFAERSLVDKKTVSDRSVWPHIAERWDSNGFSGLPPSNPCLVLDLV